MPCSPYRTGMQKLEVKRYLDGKKKKEIPWGTGKFSLGVQNEAGQRLIEFCQEKALIIPNILFQQQRQLYTWTSPDGQHKNQTDYILCSQRWRTLYSQQKQYLKLTAAQFMSSLLQNSNLCWRKQEKPLGRSGAALIKSLMITQWKWQQIQGIKSDRVPQELWMEVTGGGDQNHPKERYARRKNGCLWRVYK